ncbi:hypothetical protein ACWDG1_06450 [Streptomyces sp. NPDC001177]
MTLTPLDGLTGDGHNAPPAPGTSAVTPSPAPALGDTAGGDIPGSPSAAGTHPGRGTDRRTSPPPSTPTPAPGPTGAPPSPAALTWDTPSREATDKRWCEKVTVTFHNSGGTAARSGEVTFGTHVIGALGIDWATIESTENLPTPVEAGTQKKHTWTVCVDAWRVPLGMHIETRDVAVDWK